MSVLAHLVLPEEHADFAERILRTAGSVLETHGASVERTEIGSCTALRSTVAGGRIDGVEVQVFVGVSALSKGGASVNPSS